MQNRVQINKQNGRPVYIIDEVLASKCKLKVAVSKTKKIKFRQYHIIEKEYKTANQSINLNFKFKTNKSSYIICGGGVCQLSPVNCQLTSQVPGHHGRAGGIVMCARVRRRPARGATARGTARRAWRTRT